MATKEKIGGAAVGSVAGMIIGGFVAGPPGAVILGRLGALAGAHLADK